jgi:hypothetical protein
MYSGATNFAWRLDDYLQAIPLHFINKSASPLKSSEPASKTVAWWLIDSSFI